MGDGVRNHFQQTVSPQVLVIVDVGLDLYALDQVVFSSWKVAVSRP
jgi:hypothetical protein